jgi:hypothetical protein
MLTASLSEHTIYASSTENEGYVESMPWSMMPPVLVWIIDLILLKLDESFDQLEPVKLKPNNAQSSPGDKLTTIGLGLTDPDNPCSLADTLQEVTLQTIATSDCFPEDTCCFGMVLGETEFVASSSVIEWRQFRRSYLFSR